MKHTLLAALAACALATGCAHPAYVSPVEVTRFVGDQPAWLAQGTIEITAAPGIEADSLEYGIFHEAVRRELESLGYRVVAHNGEQVAQVALAQFVGPREQRGSGAGVGVGGSTGSYGSGVGVGVGINLNSLSGPPPERIETELSVAIRRPEGGINLWEGRAAMVATTNSDFAGDAEAATRVAEALFRDFPGQSGETIAVE